MDESTNQQIPTTQPTTTVQTPVNIPPSPATQTTNPLPPSEKPKKKFPAPLIIGIVLFLLLAGAGFAFKDRVMNLISTSTDSGVYITPEWKTYNSTLFSFKYPEEFSIKSSNNKHNLVDNKGNLFFSISNFDPNKDVPYCEQNNDASRCKFMRTVDDLQITIDWKEYMATSKNLMFKINQEDEKSRKLFVNILTTLKYIRQDTSTWKTYSNEDFVFKHPSSWEAKMKPFESLNEGTREMLSGTIKEHSYLFLMGSPPFGYMSFYETVDNITISQLKDFIKNKLIASRLTSKVVKIDNQLIESYHGCNNPEICEDFSAYILPLKKGGYMLLEIRSDEKSVEQILSTFKFVDQATTPTPTCMKRPACLDATPSCMLPEPAEGWCPE